jgi:hypothetical protein
MQKTLNWSNKKSFSLINIGVLFNNNFISESSPKILTAVSYTGSKMRVTCERKTTLSSPMENKNIVLTLSPQE